VAKAVDMRGLEELVRPVVAGLGYDLVDLEWKHEAGNFVLRLLIDVAWTGTDEAPRSVGHEDCARVSYTVGAELDVADAIHVPFNLEVSSPGLNRPLKREEDFRRFAGQKAKVRTRTPVVDPVSPAGRRNFAGKLLGTDAGRVKIDVDGQQFEIPIDDVEKANLVYEF